jgi:transcriptional regulator with XRE-family HTH domain
MLEKYREIHTSRILLALRGCARPLEGMMELEAECDTLENGQFDDAIVLRRALGERISGLRRTLRLTQEEFADRTGISVSYLSMIERAQRTPHIATLARVAKELGVSVSQLFDGLEEGDRTLLPLVSYLARRRLDSTEINALLKVAQVMFR